VSANYSCGILVCVLVLLGEYGFLYGVLTLWVLLSLTYFLDVYSVPPGLWCSLDFGLVLTTEHHIISEDEIL
jgi:hypothetical protein